MFCINAVDFGIDLFTIDMNQIILTHKKECVVEGNILVLSPEGLVV